MKKKAIIAGATGVLCGFLYTAVKKNKAKNIEEEKENTDNVIVVGASGSGKNRRSLNTLCYRIPAALL